MNPRALQEPLRNSTARCADLMAMAERELAAFFQAVTRMFGSEQAQHTAEDWLHELIEIDGLPTSVREWRLLTAKVAPRLASQVPALPLSIEFTHA